VFETFAAAKTVSDAAGNASSLARVAKEFGETPSVTAAPAVVAKITLVVSAADAAASATLEAALRDARAAQTLQAELAAAGVHTSAGLYSVYSVHVEFSLSIA
jgi:hypothetical protein